jgi:NAD(P)-dependent dehydrogenase (short-subunit alcohol dehydrogenase family)
MVDSAGRDCLAGSAVVVVGGTSGIGFAVAQAAIAAGAAVTVGARDVGRMAAELPAAAALTVDVTDEQSVEAAFAAVGELDHLVCTAASGFPPGLLRAPAEDVRALIESKLWGQYRCARAAAPRIRAGGSMTFTSGIRSRRPVDGTGAFAVANSAVEGMARALAVEIAPIRVNAIAPGTVDTPLFAAMPEEVRVRRFERVAAQTTVGRVGTAEEIAAVVLMLMRNGYVTGTVLDIDGGALLV